MSSWRQGETFFQNVTIMDHPLMVMQRKQSTQSHLNPPIGAKNMGLLSASWVFLQALVGENPHESPLAHLGNPYQANATVEVVWGQIKLDSKRPC